MYADDVVLLASSAEELRTSLLIMERIAREWGMAISYDKTVVLVVGDQARAGVATQEGQPAGAAHAACTLQHGTVEEKKEFVYLGSLVDSSGSFHRETSRRMALANGCFKQLQPKVFHRGGVSLSTKMRMYNCIVKTKFSYGAAESWATSPAQWRRVDVFHNTCLRRLMHVSRLEHMSNWELYRRTHSRPMSVDISIRRMQYVGHMARRSDSRDIKKLLFAWSLLDADLAGHGDAALHQHRAPKLLWVDHVRKDFAEYLLPAQGVNWYALAQDRTAWRNAIDEGLRRKGYRGLREEGMQRRRNSSHI